MYCKSCLTIKYALTGEIHEPNFHTRPILLYAPAKYTYIATLMHYSHTVPLLDLIFFS